MSDFKSVVAEVKVAYDIVDYIHQSGVNLKQAGVNKFKGLCPFHNEKSPSFSVDSHFQNYRCFGCGQSGDLITFVQEFEHLEFFDALKKLADDKDIKIDVKEEKDGINYTSLRSAMREISNFYYKEFKSLNADHPARIEISKRGLSDDKILYGYAPEKRRALYDHLKSNGFDDETILATGACIKFQESNSFGDFWNGRLMFFITDITGKPIGWSGRKLYETDKRGKYVNSPDGPLFDKSASLYNIFKAKKKASEDKVVYVAEGQFDVASFVEADLTNAVAASGTAFTEKQGMILRRLVGEDGRIIFCFDGDEAGAAAAEKVFKNVPLIHSQAYVVSFPDGLDPDTYREEFGIDSFKEFIHSNAKPLVEFVLDRIKKDFDLDNEIEKTKYVNSAARVLRSVTSNVLREIYTKKVSLDTFTSIEVVKNEIKNSESLISKQRKDIVENKKNVLIPETDENVKSFEELLNFIETHEIYKISAQLVGLALRESTLVDEIESIVELIPSDFHETIKELINYTEPKIIPENFTNTLLIKELIEKPIFPFEHLMNEERKRDHFNYLSDRLRKLLIESKENEVKKKIAKVLIDSPNQDSEFFAKALKSEVRGLKHINNEED